MRCFTDWLKGLIGRIVHGDSDMSRFLTGLCVTVALTVLGACGGGVKTLSYDSLDQRPAFLVEVKLAPPAQPTVSVSQSVVAMDPGAPLPAMPANSILAPMREEAAKRGANFLLIERLDTRWRRVYYGTGLKLSQSQEGALKACAHTGAVESRDRVVAQAGRCLQDLSRTRPALRARIDASLVIDAFGGLKGIVHRADSSRDGQVRSCLLKPAAKASYGRSGDYTCELSVQLELK